MRVLVAEDSALVRVMLRDAVTQLGHECLLAVDGESAWTLFQEHGADVIISDRMMPGMDGLELCRRVRGQPGVSYTYFIFLTALARKSERFEGMQEGADDYLVKPLDLDELRARLIAAGRVTGLHRRLEEQARSLERSNEALFDMARTDSLTGLGNRLLMMETLEALQSRVERYGQSYALALCDLDRFKAYNDRFGHLAGDQVLQRAAAIIAAQCRASDSLYRYGGEEILILFPHQSLESTRQAAERLRRAVEAAGIPHPDNDPYGVVTVSIGVASPERAALAGSDQVLHWADEALYEAKRRGRNRVELHAADVPA